MKLTNEQKQDIINYIKVWSVKSILETIDSLGWKDEEREQFYDEIDSFLANVEML